MFWGITPALNFLEEYKTNIKPLPDELNILLIGGCDARHIFQTIAKRYRFQKVKLNFYIMEQCMENIAKQLLLLNTALQPESQLGLYQKTKLFMELYGNTLIRTSYAKYLSATALELIKMVTDYDYLSKMMGFVKLDIKYKERDYLENLLKFWCGIDEFNICEIWDRRVRRMLGTRYDSKLGAFDWDLHMRYKTIGGQQICNQEYRNFRMNGVAFSWLESEVSKPNRSMVCAVQPNGDNFFHYGYIGDIQTGPFVAYGLDCEDKDFLKCNNGQNTYRATDVIERNLNQIFFEILNGTEYIHQKISEMTLGSVVMKQDKMVIDIKQADLITRSTRKCIDLEDVQINFLTISLLSNMKYKEEFKDFFDIVYFGSTYLKHMEKDVLGHIIKSDGLMFVENQLFVLDFRKKQLEEHEEKVRDKIDKMMFNTLPFDVQKDYWLKCVANK